MTKFKEVPEQQELGLKISNLLKSGYDNVICIIPTGWGKSGLSMQISKQFESSVILNHNRVLVDQYDDLLNDIKDVCCIKGADNYRCLLDSSYDVTHGILCSCGAKCISRGSCEYYYRKALFSYCKYGISNYQFALTHIDIEKYEREKSEVLICDECHNLESILVEYRTCGMNVELIKIIKNYVKKIPKRVANVKSFFLDNLSRMEYIITSTNESNYESKFEEFYYLVASMMTFAKSIVDEASKTYSQSVEIMKDYTQLVSIQTELRRTHCKYENYKKSEASNFLYEKVKDGHLRLVPIDVSVYFKLFREQIAEKLVLMSATVLDPNILIKSLGLDPRKTKVIEVGSKFPPENRPNIFVPVTYVNYKNTYEGSKDMNNIILNIKSIIKKHIDNGESGFIYAPSYKLCKIIIDGMKDYIAENGYKLLANTGSEDSNSVLKRFTNTMTKKKILISPSFVEGVNFSGDISRFQVIVKTPYPSLGDKRVNYKMQRDQRWYEIETFTKLVQVSGRSVRYEGDYCITYYLDRNSLRLYNKIKNSCPNWFNESVHIID